MRLLLLLFCLCNATPVFAFDDLTLRFGSITGEGWQMHNVVVHLQGLSSKKPALSINIATFNWVLLKKTLRKLEFQCSDSQYTVAKIICPYATLHLKSQLLDEPEVKLSFSYDIAQQRIHFNVQRLAFANGYITIQSKVVGTGWWIKCHIQQVDLKKMLTTLNTLITIPQTFTFGGETTLTLEITGATTIQQAKINGQFSALSFSNAAGSQAFENLTGKIIVNAQQTAASWRGQITLTIEQGELYSEPVYIGVEAKQPLNATIDLTWQTSQLTIHHFAYTHTGILAVEGFSDLLFNQALNQVSVKQLTVQLAQSSLANIYTHYVQTGRD